MDAPLQGRRIAVPETRLLPVLRKALEERGAEVIACPLVGIHDVEDPAPVDAWLRDYCERGCDWLVLLTGEGLRRLHHRAERIELAPAFLERLAATQILARGPKPAAALREHGIRPQMAADPPTTEGVIAGLKPLDLAGKRVGVQLYGTAPNLPLEEFLRNAGAQACFVAPYRYADEAEDARVERLIHTLAAGEIDAIAFTSSPQVRRLYQVAEATGLGAELERAWQRTLVAAVGPVVRDALEKRGVPVTVMPDDAWFIKPLVNALVRQFKAPD